MIGGHDTHEHAQHFRDERRVAEQADAQLARERQRPLPVDLSPLAGTSRLARLDAEFTGVTDFAFALALPALAKLRVPKAMRDTPPCLQLAARGVVIS